ncbi:MFS transporter [Nonomuraea sp. NPDC049152]|uniref:MFS transporter n=1 Tax=Nonomuraea sp. NPDC049152 TaxID=3154350 RepID=UPI0033D0A784
MTAQLPGASALGPWIVLAYNGLFAAALLLAGVTADRMARTRFFAVGNVVVAATGLLSVLAPNLLSLVALRAVAGVGAAMGAAGGSSMVLAVYPPEERRRVYGYAGAVLGSSLALGPIVAQALMAIGGWPLVFVAPGAVAAIAALATLGLPGLRSPDVSDDFDLAGAVLFGVTVAAVVTALGMGFGTGVPWWGPGGLILVAAASATGLIRVERRAAGTAAGHNRPVRLRSHRRHPPGDQPSCRPSRRGRGYRALSWADRRRPGRASAPLRALPARRGGRRAVQHDADEP